MCKVFARGEYRRGSDVGRCVQQSDWLVEKTEARIITSRRHLACALRFLRDVAPLASSSMKITIVTGPWLPVPPVQGGSVPRMWQGLAEEFAARRHDVLVMPRRYPGQPEVETCHGVHYKRYGGFDQGHNIYFDLAKDFVYAADLARHLPAADILVVNDFWLPVLAGLLRHAGMMVVSANRFPKRQFALYRRVPRIIAASRAIERAIIAQTPAIASRVRHIPNPLDVHTFVPPKGAREGRKIKTILYVGRLHPEKGVHVLVAAFARIHAKHPDAALRIVGPSRADQGGGGGRYLQELRGLAAESPVKFSEPEFHPAALAKIYQDADLFCYPTIAERGEALPVAPLEAMSTGLPVIVSRLDCFDDYVVEGETGLSFDHWQRDAVGSLAAKIDEALIHWPRSLAMGRRARDVAQRFGLRQVADEFVADFATLLSSR